MKLLVFALCCAVLSQQVVSQEPLVIKDKIRDIFKCLKKVMQNGMPDVGLPILDPLNIPKLTIDLAALENPAISGTLDITDLLAQGLANFDLGDMDASLSGIGLKLKLKFREPKMTLNSNYNLKVLLSGLPITGNGEVNVLTNDFVLSLDTKVELHMRKIHVEKLRIYPTIGNLNLEITGLLGNEELSKQISALVSEKVQTYINENSNEIGVKIGDYLKETINHSYSTEYDINNIIHAIKKKCIKL